jgi:hypothetical protein
LLNVPTWRSVLYAISKNNVSFVGNRARNRRN